MGQSPDPKPLLLAGVMGLLAVSGAAVWLMMAPMPVEERSAPAPSVTTIASSPSTGGPSPAPAPAPAPARARTPERSSQRSAPATGDRMARDLERERIWSALRERHELEPESPGATAPSSAAAAVLPSLNADYVRAAIREQLVPVAVDCYNSALQDEPELGGKLVLDFAIVGAEDVGGIVEDAEVTDESTLDSAFVKECMRESLLAVTFEPPPGGGRVEVTYPFVFEPE